MKLKRGYFSILLAILVAGVAIANTGQLAAQALPEIQEHLEDRLDSEQTALDLSDELDRRQLAVDQMISATGIYAPELIELYGELAGIYQQLQNYSDAAEIYQQALQVTRINAGLNSERQMPLLAKLVETYTAMSEWEDVDKMQHLSLYVANRSFKPGDSRYAQAVNDYGNWKLRLLKENLLQDNYRSMNQQADELASVYSESIAKIDAQPIIDEPGLIPLLTGKSRAELESARYLSATPYQYFPSSVSQLVTETVCQNVSDGRGGVVRSCYNVQRVNPRYDRSQRDNKRLEVTRTIRELEKTMDRLREILIRHPDLPLAQQSEMQTHIAELEVELQRIVRDTNRIILY